MLKKYTTKKILEICEESGNDKDFMKKVWIPKEQSNKQMEGKMKKVYKTNDGEYGDFSWLTFEFIKSIDMVKEFDLFKQAIIKEEIDVFT